jgi:glycosyltransferase involved in cell wall biosynthesis
MFDRQAEARANWGRLHGFKSAAILYDLIPISHPQLCDPAVCAGFPSYLRALGSVDALWSISDFTLREFGRYLDKTRQNLPQIFETVSLPGQFGEQPRNLIADSDSSAHETRILFVSTLEPRKNHALLLQAFHALRERQRELPLRLVLIGNRYSGAPEIAEEVRMAGHRDPSIEWLGPVDDARLADEFRRCSFTVYPSLVEGYGLPILESLWMGRPCVTHNAGVMRELAVPGGCITADMTDPEAILRALERLATDHDLLANLRKQALQRQICTWQEYADEIADRLYAL